MPKNFDLSQKNVDPRQKILIHTLKIFNPREEKGGRNDVLRFLFWQVFLDLNYIFYLQKVFGVTYSEVSYSYIL